MGNARNFAFWVVLFLMILALFNLFSDGTGNANSRQISYSEFMQRVQTDQVSAVVIDGENVAITTANGEQLNTIRPLGEELAGKLVDRGVDVRVVRQQSSGFMSM
ncbi:MAG: ATP-dependent metallopeptidase FtsH/Yme1/Tma family protein, partial [Paracoccus sp. (in: a-proteobacteria)]|nr:ATP-dependent metallopeptidase FtsH/Yme1/Tma family protein [Paracoccus sp. (in: a-proteobacteria)]